MQLSTEPRASKSIPGAGAVRVDARGPWSVGVVLWRDESARVLATIVAKVTYKLCQGTSEIVTPPDPIRRPDETWDDGASDSLRFPSDLAPFKAAHEVLVVGHAYANGRQPAHGTTARVVVAGVDKVIAATAPRHVDRAGRIQIGAPQSRFSLRYELAAGGPDNPVGVDPTFVSPMGGHALPQLVPPNVDVRPGDAVPVVGLGPIARSWSLRDGLLRPEDRGWVVDPLRSPRPRGFDLRYFNASPIDQRSSEPLRPDARIILEGLHPAHPRLVTNLPGAVPILRSLGASHALPDFVADTLFIDTDREIATLSFRAILATGEGDLVLEVVSDGAVEASGAEETTELDRRAIAAVGDETAELDRSIFTAAAAHGRGGALPFRASSSDLVPPAPPPLPARGSAPALPASTLPRDTPSSPTSLPPPPARVGGAAPSPAPMPVSSSPGFLPPPPSARSTALPAVAPGSLPPFGPPSGGAPAPVAEAPRDEAPRPIHPRDLFRSAFAARAQTSAPVDAPRSSTASDARPASPTIDAAPAVGSPVSARAASDAAIVSDPRNGRVPSEEGVRLVRRAVVDLVAFDGEVPGRLRRSPVHAPLLVAASPPPRTHQPVDIVVADRSKEESDRREVLRVLSCGTPLAAADLGATIDELLDDPFDYDVPLLLVEGEVRPTMDEIETLRVATEIVKPLAGAQKRVQSALALANDALTRPIAPLPEAASALYRQLEASTSELSLPPRHVADLVDRTLLASRSFKKRTLLGAPRIRTDLAIGRVVFPLYLPESVSSQLPLLPSFPLVALVELRPREDASETNPSSLVALAMGRVLRSRPREHRG